ncbi:MAG TPA: hypothetical protein VH253_01170 [Phycisphaerae bacterium]|nr:hypothetical protein [Phycisphaerae bacterium]
MKTAASDRFVPSKRSRAKKKPQARKKKTSVFDLLKDFAGAIKDGPPDLARNHDHYAHGTAKRPV